MLRDFYIISAVIYRTTELIFIIIDLYNFASLDRLESFSTVRRWSMNLNSATTNLLRRWWKELAASTSGVEKRPTQLLASTWHGMVSLFIELTNRPSCSLFYWTYLLCSYSSQAFKQGGRRGAKKVMIVITDGESHDSPDLQQAIEDSEKDGITRYAIAVSLRGLFSIRVKWCRFFERFIHFQCRIEVQIDVGEVTSWSSVKARREWRMEPKTLGPLGDSWMWT